MSTRRTYRCPICARRLFDVIEKAAGAIEIKCPRCKQITLASLNEKQKSPAQ